MNKGKIIIIECFSTAVNYISDIRKEGYEPIVMSLYCRSKSKKAYMKKFQNNAFSLILEDTTQWPEIIDECAKYEDTLAQIRKINPKLIIPGTDDGIELAMKLSKDLGLVNNDIKNYSKIRNKYIAQQALKKAGIRSIEGVLVDNYDEAIEFFNYMNEKGKAVIVKPVAGVSSYGVYLCKNEDELKKAITKNKRNIIYSMLNGGTGKILVQECIEGTEYVVNSVSYNGNHRITCINKYKKNVIPQKGIVYDYSIGVDPETEEARALVEYQLKVLDAIGIEVGPVHSEIMMDKDGPVLIEANCRICGTGEKSEIQDEIYGYHETELALKSYLYPDSITHEDDYSKLVLCKNNNSKVYIFKELTLEKTTYIKDVHPEKAFGTLSSYRGTRVHSKKGFFYEASNLSTSIGRAFFVCESREEANRCIDYIHDVEKNHPELLYTSVPVPIITKLMGKIHIG